ncbi:MAG: DUF5615 family PIN-like protein [Planctomycetota bacterium]
MRLLADENFPRTAIVALRSLGLDVLSVMESARGSDDVAVLTLARTERRILLTLDKDFGELAFRCGLPLDCGVLLIRFSAESPELLAHRIVNVLHSQASWKGVFASMDEERVRVRPLPKLGD